MNRIQWREALNRLYEDRVLMREVVGKQILAVYAKSHLIYRYAIVLRRQYPYMHYVLVLHNGTDQFHPNSGVTELMTVPLDKRRKAFTRSEDAYSILENIITPIMREWKINRLLE